MSTLHRHVSNGTLRARFGGVLLLAVFAGDASSTYAEGGGSPVEIQVSGSSDRIVLQCTLGDYQTRRVRIDGEDFEELLVAGEPVTMEVGAPRLPKVCRSIIIPDDARMAIRVLAADYYEVPADIAPSKGNLPRSIDPADVPYAFGEAYRADAFYPGELARLGTPYILRDYRGVVVKFYPFQYNPVTGVLRVYKNITLEVVRTGPGETNVLERNASERRPSRAFHQLYKHHFTNYGSKLRYPPLDEDGDMLIIAHDPWIPNVEPLAAHKNSIGIDTTVVGVSTIGNNASAIHNYIQSVYDASDLAFVLLVGDIQQVATPYDPGAPSDPTYAKLAGGDDYPDIMVGRLSAQSTLHVHTQVQRTIEYEVNQATQQEWFWRGAGIGSEPGHLDSIRDELLAHGYTHVDQIYDPDATPEMIAAALNEGRGIVNYIGHGSSSFWGTGSFFISDINELVNADLLPFIFSVASCNGNFAVDECFAEAWLRAEQGGVPTGAIATYMASDYQYWDGPQVAQQEFVDLYVNEAYVSFGTLCFAGSCRMIDEYGSTGVMMFDTWIVFGDPSLRVVGTVSPPSTWYVDDDAPNDPGPGDPTISDPLEDGSQQHPFDAIQEGIDAALDGDTVLVLDGTYNELMNLNGKAITVRSSDGPDATTIDGTALNDSVVKCISGEGVDTVLEGFTITGGTGDPSVSPGSTAGGGMRCEGSSPTVSNCAFIANTASDPPWGDVGGGGMYNANGSNPTVVDCTFSGNSAGDGGGMCNRTNSSPTVINCAYSENEAYREGGGMYNWDSQPTVTHCTFSGNYAMGGGGIHNESFSSPTVTNCMFSGNYANTDGGGMYNWDSQPTVTNCTFSGNYANMDGGGMCNWPNSVPTVVNCTFSENEAYQDGGGMLNWQSDPRLSNCTFNGNSSSDGGGMCNASSSPTLINCTFSGNWAVGDCGGIGNTDGSDATLINCTFSGNWAVGDGGGMYTWRSSPTLTNCTFAGNAAGDDGGGMYNFWDSSPDVTNCTFSGNTAGGEGGGMYNYNSISLTVNNCTFSGNSAASGTAVACDSYEQEQPSTIEMGNCILWDAGAEIWNNDDSVIAITYSDVQGGWPGIGNIDADPLFVDPDGPDNDPNTWEDNDYHLAAGSPCIDAGCNCDVPPDFADLDGDGDTDEITPFDLDGEGRFFDDPDTPDSGSGWPPIVDMGAYEFGGSGPQPCIGDLDNDRDVDLSDLAALLSHYGATSGMTQADGDLDCDGDVDLDDLNRLLGAYGTTCE